MKHPFHPGDWVWVKLKDHAPEVAYYGWADSDCEYGAFYLVLDKKKYQIGDFEAVYGLVVHPERYAVCEKIKDRPNDWESLLSEDEQKFVKRTCSRCIVEGCPTQQRGRCFLRALANDQEKIHFKLDRTPPKVDRKLLCDNWLYTIGTGFTQYYRGPWTYPRRKKNPSKHVGPYPQDVTAADRRTLLKYARAIAKRHVNYEDEAINHLIRKSVGRYLTKHYGYSDRLNQLK